MGATNDPLGKAREVIDGATERGIPLRLVGGLAVRFLTPTFPPRVREGQDMDFASSSAHKGPVMDYLGECGFVGDRRFNTMHGHRQMYFVTADGGTAVDVIMDQLTMCHILEFKDRLDRMPYTLDVADLLLTKLQVVEQNEKDVHDIVYLLAAHEVRAGDEPGTIGLDRVGRVIGEDWGWWRTVTGNLERVIELAGPQGDLRRLVPEGAPFDPVAQARALRRHADETPKTLRWKLRARVGDRVQWYELPEEVAH